MNTTDILLFEAGAGGDFAIINDDLAMGETLYEQIYLALFGGNIEASTKLNYLPTEERNDYWGNSLIWKDQKDLQFNSETERAIQNNALNSSGRLKILQAVETDLAYLKSMLKMTTEVQILGRDNLQIIVNFTEVQNQQNRALKLVYSNAKNEIIIEKIL
jgi:hypothetical protein